MNAFFDSQFKYCHSRTNKGKIDRLHERCFRIISKDKQSSFKDLLQKDSSVSIHEKMYTFWLLKCIRSAITINLLQCKTKL